jgi:hypothetical protein
MARIVAIVAVVALGAACGTDRSTAPPPPPHPSAALLPASTLPRMEAVVSEVDPASLVAEVTHPEALTAVLADAGFAGARQRSFSGGTGAFSRVTARGLAFETSAGADAFLEWFGDHAGTEIVTAERIEPDGIHDGVIVFRHEPDPCCHNDVPAYVAAWRRGTSVLYLHVGGRKATTAAFTDLIADYDREA